MMELLLLAHLTAEVADRWEKYHLTPQQKSWFSNVHTKLPGPSCCSVADGVPADDWKREVGDDQKTHYWVLLDRKWWQVPDKAVILEFGNPIGVPIVWFTDPPDNVRCFVPGVEN